MLHSTTVYEIFADGGELFGMVLLAAYKMQSMTLYRVCDVCSTDHRLCYFCQLGESNPICSLEDDDDDVIIPGARSF